MRRVATACLASVLLYALCCCLLLDRPLTLGALSAAIEAKLARAAAIDGGKLVILAGSNGPYSHRCVAMEPILGLPCVNGGVAVGVGLDYLFARWEPLLRAGDIVYLPMEPEQYTRTRQAMQTGPDAAIMARHDRATLISLPPLRWAAALFASDLRACVMALAEMALAATRFADPRASASGTMNPWGDQVGHGGARAAANRTAISSMRPMPVQATQVRAGYGASVIALFAARMTARGVIVIGGLSVGFDDVALPEEAEAAMAMVYTAQGGRFLHLDNRGRYPRDCFFDGPEHLCEECQIAHAERVARGLAAMLAGPALLGMDHPGAAHLGEPSQAGSDLARR